MERADLYKIGELASLCDVSPRTIDYYTKIGLIQPEKRSEKNYRLYNEETLQRLKQILSLKAQRFSLNEIRQALHRWNASHDRQMTDKLTDLQIHLRQLEREVNALKPMIEQLKPNQAKSLLKRLTPQSVALIEALLILVGKSSLM